MHKVLYALCALTSLSCAVLLLHSYLRTRFRLLLWSGMCFVGLTINNAMLITDRLVFPAVDLSLWRLTATLVAVLLLVYGLIMEGGQ